MMGTAMSTIEKRAGRFDGEVEAALISDREVEARTRSMGQGLFSRGTYDRRTLEQIAAISAIFLAILMALPLLRGHVSVHWDSGALHLPIREFYAECLARGDSFDWMPGQYGGFFMTGEGEAGCYHPLHFVLYRFLPLDVAFAFEYAANYAIMLAGMVIFLRRKIGLAGAWLAGLTYTFSASNVNHGVNFVQVLAHLPWLMWSLDRIAAAASRPARLRACALLGLLTGSQILAGHPQATSYSLFTEVLYASFLIWKAESKWSIGTMFFGGKLIGLLIGAVQLLATLAFLGETNRTTFDPFFGSISPVQLVQFVAPFLLTENVPEWSGESIYFGSVSVVLGLYWLGNCFSRSLDVTQGTHDEFPVLPQKSELRLRHFGLFAIGLCLLATWLATGWYGGLYKLQTLLPVVGQFRAPARYANLVVFGAALLTGLGLVCFMRLVESNRRIPLRALTLPWLGVLVAFVVSILFCRQWHFRDEDSIVLVCLSLFWAPLVMFAATTSLSLGRLGRPSAIYALPVLAALDIGFISLGNSRDGLPTWATTTSFDDWKAQTPRPPNLSAGRVFSNAWQPQRMLHLGGRLINGYRGGLEPLKHLDYMQPNALRVAEVAWYSPWFDRVLIEGLTTTESGWQRVPNPLPRARMLTETYVSRAPQEDIQRVDVDRVALVFEPLDVEAGAPGEAAIVEDRPGQIAVTTRAASRQLLVVSESYSRGWYATLDGEPLRVERVNGDFIGCVVEAGEHRVELQFRPPAVAWGRRLSLAGAGLCLLLGIVSIDRSGKSKQNTARIT
jgi:hypothetical protein